MAEWRGNLGAMRAAQQATGANSSFEMDRAEGGTANVSSDLRARLEMHGIADDATLQVLWNLNVWSAADLAGMDSERLVQVRLHCTGCLWQLASRRPPPPPASLPSVSCTLGWGFSTCLPVLGILF